MTDVELLEESIKRSGLSLAEYARRGFPVPARRVKRWLNREHPIPADVRTHLQAELGVDKPPRRARRRKKAPA